MSHAKILTDAADLIEERAEVATPGPWEVGDRWHIQSAAMCECHRHGPLTWSGVRDINGTAMPAHVHRSDTPIGSDIMQATAHDGDPLSVTIGNDYGSAVGRDDAKHMALWAPDVALLVVPILRAHADWLTSPVWADTPPKPNPHLLALAERLLATQNGDAR